jgi:hypothetical protein
VYYRQKQNIKIEKQLRKTSDGRTEASHLVSQLETLITGMFNKETLIDHQIKFLITQNHLIPVF